MRDQDRRRPRARLGPKVRPCDGLRSPVWGVRTDQGPGPSPRMVLPSGHGSGLCPLRQGSLVPSFVASASAEWNSRRSLRQHRAGMAAAAVRNRRRVRPRRHLPMEKDMTVFDISELAACHDGVSLLRAVQVPRLPVSRLEPVIGAGRYAGLARAAGRVRRVLAGRAVWNVNSTAAGGGVAEMLQILVGYVQDLDIPVGWLVITGDAEFFSITKRLHNQIHGSMSGGPLGAAEAGHYAQMLAANAVELTARVRPGDVVLLHDPQTAGLAAPLAQAGARVVWRCHIGVDWENEATRAGWDFLRPHLAAAEAFVFSRRG